MGQMVQTHEEIDRFLQNTDPKLFGFSPDTAHLDLAGCDVPGTIDRYKDRIHFLDYKDARRTIPKADIVQPNGKVLAKDSSDASFFDSIYDLGDGEVDFPACHRVLKKHPLPRLGLRRSGYSPLRPTLRLPTLRRLHRQEAGANLPLDGQDLQPSSLFGTDPVLPMRHHKPHESNHQYQFHPQVKTVEYLLKIADRF